MEILCTRPHCGNQNQFNDLDDPLRLKTTQQKYCTTCGMHLILGGRYLVEKLLGQGGFGTAYLARDRFTPKMRQCVVKQFQPVGNLDDQQLALAQGLFEREAHVLEDIGNRHRQIPDLYAYFPLIVPKPNGSGDEQFFYLVQEYIDGQDLEQELEAKGAFTEAEITEILLSMLPVLEFVHTEGSIHRDIKPSNIMRRQDGRLYLLDFGAVKQVTVAPTQGSSRSTGIYSPGYAPPEQMRGAQVFPATDLYALAVTCAVLLTNEAPDVLFDAFSNTWQWEKYTTVSPLLTTILNQMLEASPGDRPISAQAVLDHLQPSPPPTPVTSTPTPSAQTHIQTAPNAAPPTPRRSPPTPQQPAQSANNASAPTVYPAVAQTPSQPSHNNPQSNNQGSIIPSLFSAAFIGGEGVLLYFAVVGLIGGNLGIGLWGAAMGGLIFATIRKHLPLGMMPVLAIASAGLGLSFANIAFVSVLFFAVMAGAGVTFAFILFTVIYKIFSAVL